MSLICRMSLFIKVIFLAIVQGLTEFLPVSSSGHLVLFKHLLGLDAPGATLEVALHAGTLISILFYYRKRMAELVMSVFRGEGEGRTYAIAVACSCLPAVVVYGLLGGWLEASFDKPGMAGIMLCVTGVILLTFVLQRTGQDRKPSVGRGIVVGLGQAFALLPGVSRSGTTITVGRHLGLSPRVAAEFSMLMVVPLIAGATLQKALSLSESGMGELTAGSLIAGLLVSAIVGYFAIAWLVRALTHGKFWMFGIYCLIVGGVVIVLC